MTVVWSQGASSVINDEHPQDEQFFATLPVKFFVNVPIRTILICPFHHLHSKEQIIFLVKNTPYRTLEKKWQERGMEQNYQYVLQVCPGKQVMPYYTYVSGGI